LVRLAAIAARQLQIARIAVLMKDMVALAFQEGQLSRGQACA